jgi:NADPH:quinone reductase-like Zn-dependent oxidoreductase
MSSIIVFEEYGDPSVLHLRDEILPPPGAQEVTIANRAIAVNPADWKVVAGYAKDFIPLQFPAVPGTESAGVVTAIGSDVDTVAIGDEVIWAGFGNAYRAEANVPASAVFPKDPTLDFEQAAALTVAGGSAYGGLRAIGVGAGDTLLVHGVAGGVGTAVAQIARHLGARVIGTASARNHGFVADLGAVPVEYGAGLVERVRALGRVDAVFDAHGGAECVAATVALLDDLTRATTVVQDEHSAAAGIAPVPSAADGLGPIVAAVADLAVRGVLRFDIQERIPLAEAARALELSITGHVRGKLILVP